MIAWLACFTPQPEVDADWVAVRAAVDAWERGADALADGRLDEAVMDLADAVAARPGDLLLRAWLAEAHALRGEHDAALTAFDAVLSVAPDFADVRRRRAALLVRMERLDEAGADLRAAVAGDWSAARAVKEDPDFADVIDHPAFSFVPKDTLLVVAEAPPGLVFWGTEATLRVRVVGAGDHAIRLVGPRTEAPFTVRLVRETTSPSTEGPLRDLSYTLLSTGAGDVELAGFRVDAGPWSAPLPHVAIRSAAPPGRERTVEAVDLRTPAEVLGSLDDGDARYASGVLQVAGHADDRVTVTPDPGPPDRAWTWVNGETSRSAWEWTDLPRTPARVQVEGDGVRRWDGPPATARR